MITIATIVIIWVIVSSYKVLRSGDNFDKMIYGTGLCVGIACIIITIVFLIIRYLP